MTTKHYLSRVESLGLGITNKCNLNCAHCYSRALPLNSLSLEEVKMIIGQFPNVKKINFGTGESILNPEFVSIITWLKSQKIQMALTTNGMTIAMLDNNILKLFKDVDVSLDFPTKKLHDHWRSDGAFKKALGALERCQQLNINTSIALCLTSANYLYLADFRTLLDRFKISLRINIYKPVPNKIDNFSLTYNQFWKAIKILADNFLLISNSEPILSIIDQRAKIKGCPCGEKSARVHPDGTITPCVFLSGQKIDFPQFENFKKIIPKLCQSCQYLPSCHGGCLARKILKNHPEQPDEYCPLLHCQKIPNIKFRYYLRGDLDFIHASYLCTLIVA